MPQRDRCACVYTAHERRGLGLLHRWPAVGRAAPDEHSKLLLRETWVPSELSSASLSSSSSSMPCGQPLGWCDGDTVVAEGLPLSRVCVGERGDVATMPRDGARSDLCGEGNCGGTPVCAQPWRRRRRANGEVREVTCRLARAVWVVWWEGCGVRVEEPREEVGLRVWERRVRALGDPGKHVTLALGLNRGDTQARSLLHLGDVFYPHIFRCPRVFCAAVVVLFSGFILG